jgi:hypothetical protein
VRERRSVSYALVQDVAASWEQYERFAAAMAGSPPGLILHVAGPTDEGFRIIEVWETEAAWERFSEELQGTALADEPLQLPVLRALRPVHVVFGRGADEGTRLPA